MKSIEFKKTATIDDGTGDWDTVDIEFGLITILVTDTQEKAEAAIADLMQIRTDVLVYEETIGVSLQLASTNLNSWYTTELHKIWGDNISSKLRNKIVQLADTEIERICISGISYPINKHWPKETKNLYIRLLELESALTKLKMSKWQELHSTINIPVDFSIYPIHIQKAIERWDDMTAEESPLYITDTNYF